MMLMMRKETRAAVAADSITRLPVPKEKNEREGEGSAGGCFFSYCLPFAVAVFRTVPFVGRSFVRDRCIELLSSVLGSRKVSSPSPCSADALPACQLAN